MNPAMASLAGAGACSVLASVGLGWRLAWLDRRDARELERARAGVVAGARRALLEHELLETSPAEWVREAEILFDRNGVDTGWHGSSRFEGLLAERPSRLPVPLDTPLYYQAEPGGPYFKAEP